MYRFARRAGMPGASMTCPDPDLIDFDIGPDHARSACVLIVRGELDLLTAPGLATAVTEALRDDPRLLVIDLCEVDFVDSTGFAALLDARRRTIQRGIDLRFACDVPHIRRVFSLTRLDLDLDIRPSVHEALAPEAHASLKVRYIVDPRRRPRAGSAGPLSAR
jgi:anti-sigma B factor antagonist